jgi:hypothetical protein
MNKTIRFSVMLAAILGTALLPCPPQASAQNAAKAAPASSIDLGISYTAKMAKISQLSNSTFVLNGGALDGVYWLNGRQGRLGKLGLAFDLSGEVASNIEPGINLDQIEAVFGPRYVLWRGKRAGVKPDLYAQGMIGFVDAFNSVFPVPGQSAVQAHAGSMAAQMGAGFDWPVKKNMSWRAIEADYIFTHLPNNANTYQGDLRLSTGLVFHF